MNTINELRAMSEKERMEWIVNAKSSDLNVVLKDYGVKGIANMKKLEKIVMVTKLVEENIADEDAKRVMEDTKKLNLTQKKKDEGAKLLWVEPIEALELIKNCINDLKDSQYEDVYATKFVLKAKTFDSFYFLIYNLYIDVLKGEIYCAKTRT